MSQPLKHIATALAVAAVASGVGCRGDRSDSPPRQFFPDMDQQPRWNPQDESEFFEDGRTMRHPPAHTVPFGRSAVVDDADWAQPARDERAAFLEANFEIYGGQDDFGDMVDEIPIEVTPELVRLGQKNFNIYCAVCHGYNGEGAAGAGDPTRGGMVGRRWSIPVANLRDDMYLRGGERGQDGYIFSVIRNGVGVEGAKTMPGYAYAIDAREAWAVVAYVRALQRAQRGELSDVPEALRGQLGAPPPPPAAETGGDS